jgi:hypothetical protein
VNIRIDPEILNLVCSLEKDLTKALNEALNLWLKKRLTTCPITNQFCKSTDGPCNDCALTKV